MRLLLIIYIFSFSALGFAQNKDSLYNKGIEALSTKDYNAAQDYFSQNIEVAPSFESYYNLGYAYAKNEEWSKSLWANEASLKYDPTNSKAIYNAKFALQKISPEAIWNHPYSWTKRMILSIGETTWFILMLISSLVLSISIYSLLSKRNESPKKLWSKRLIFPFLVLLVLAVFCFNEVLNHYEGNSYAYTLDEEIELYLSPEGIEVDGDLPQNTRLGVTDDLNDWVQITTQDSRTYWVKKENILVY